MRLTLLSKCLTAFMSIFSRGGKSASQCFKRRGHSNTFSGINNLLGDLHCNGSTLGDTLCQLQSGVV
ncbi:Uncharacterised protein [Klebsiella pneumoniae]|nr:Uncharacterised protein [Klebsiella pneumoniae]